MSTHETHKVALLWQADRDMRKKATVARSRLSALPMPSPKWVLKWKLRFTPMSLCNKYARG